MFYRGIGWARFLSICFCFMSVGLMDTVSEQTVARVYHERFGVGWVLVVCEW